jgi:hypothetical protein
VNDNDSPDGDKKLVQAHGGVYGNLSAEVVLDFILLDGVSGHIRHQLRQTLNSHASDSKKEKKFI